MSKFQYIVCEHDKYSRSYLLNIGKAVADFVVQYSSYAYQLANNGSLDLIGPDGVEFAVETYVPKKHKTKRTAVFIEESGPQLVRVYVPARLVKYVARSTTFPRWASEAFEYEGWEPEVMPHLYFGQVQLKVAAQLINMSADNLAEALLDRLDRDSPLLRAAVTRPAIDPMEAIFDIRGLLAWVVAIGGYVPIGEDPESYVAPYRVVS